MLCCFVGRPPPGYVVVAPDGLPERLPFTNIYHGGSWQLGNAKGDGREDIYPRVDDILCH